MHNRLRTVLRAISIISIASSLIAWGAGAPLQAQPAYPSAPIRLIVPFGAGGVTDLTGRTFGKYMAQTLGQPVVVENRPGAAATIGANHVARAAPDGHTLLLGTNVTHAISPQVLSAVPYDPLTDFAPIAMFGLNGNVLVVHPSFPANTFEEFIQYIRTKPGDINYASGSVGSSAHLAAELLKQEVPGLNYMHIPYSTPSEAMAAVIGQQVEFMFSNIGAAFSQIRAGRVKALAVTTRQRQTQLPDVPAIAESVPGFEVVGWMVAFAPKGTPPQIVTRLSRVINDLQGNAELRKTMDTASVVPVQGTPEDMERFVRDEYAKWGRVIRASKLQQF